MSLTGGLAGNGARFEETYICDDDAIRSNAIAAVGFYGDHIRVGYGCLGGWHPFGPERMITRADGNNLFELDGRHALDLYKTYLGEHANSLPSIGFSTARRPPPPREKQPSVPHHRG